MNNNSYWSRSNLLKGTETLCVLIIFGYYAYQHVMNRNMLERSLNENAAPLQRDFSHKSSQLRRTIHGNTGYKDVAGKTQNAESRDLNDYDTFNEHLDEYFEAPEDEVTYPPEIYNALIDDTEELMTE